MQDSFTKICEIGERLTEERQRVGLSQTELGKLGGKSKNTQLNYEQGDSFPTADYLAAVAKLGIDVQYVVTGNRSSGVMDPDEAELVRRYRAAPKDVRRAALGTLSPWANHNGDQES